ncbi:response regulator [Bacillus sp. FSL R9-9530]|uniref:response regulator n=1 Tax=Bacillus sp. FSL R9-9530 TaxID=2921593 RepID=UPI0030F52459
MNASELEKKAKTGSSYFDKEGLHKYVQAYAKKFSILFHQENNRSKASDYFYLNHRIEEKTLRRRL